MIRKSLKVCLGACVFALLAACAIEPLPKSGAVEATPGFTSVDLQAPTLPREFRAAWVATVANIDWPSKPGLSAEAMRDEIVTSVQTAKRLGINAFLLQVRANADAIYPSTLEPWADVLTGSQGQAPAWATLGPQAPFDPLKTWIDESHKAGIELHAWFNPYRARHVSAKSAAASNHISRTQPELVKTYGGFGWLDPGEPRAAARSLAVIEDVARRYDIDGVHIDDYFYPYPVSTVQASTVPGSATVSVKTNFPDEPSWRAYTQAGGTLTRADWRRDNVDRFVQQMDERVRAVKPWLRVGVSPFGLGKPSARPAGIRGFSQYDELYADVERWMAKGWMDYLAPQLYWPIEQKAQAFPVLLDYWAANNPAGVQVYAGLYSSRVNNTTATWQPSEINQQIDITRDRAKANPLLSGHVHFSWVALQNNRRGLADALMPLYAQAAVAPASVRTKPLAQPAPTVLRATASQLLLAPTNASRVAFWQRVGGQWQLGVWSAGQALMLATGTDAVVVSTLDRFGHESPRAAILLDAQR